MKTGTERADIIMARWISWNTETTQKTDGFISFKCKKQTKHPFFPKGLESHSLALPVILPCHHLRLIQFIFLQTESKKKKKINAI